MCMEVSGNRDTPKSFYLWIFNDMNHPASWEYRHVTVSKLEHHHHQWKFQDPEMELPAIYKAYFSGLCKGIYPQNMA